MDGKTHLLAGVVAGSGIVYLESKIGIDINDLNNTLLIAGCGVGSLLADIDIDNSMLGRFIPGWIFFEHRTVTHSIFFIGVVGLIGYLFNINLALNIGIMVGMVTHLLLDGTTPLGLPYLMFPFKVNQVRKKYR